MMSKLIDLASLIAGEDPDLLLLTETWTNKDINSAEISFKDYNIYGRKDRMDTSNGRGGGVIIYVRDNIIE